MLAAMSHSATFALLGTVLLLDLGIITLACWIAQAVGGWGRLVRAFPAHKPAPGARGGISSAGLHTWTNYTGCVRWSSDEEYLHLGLIPPFSWFFHPPMSIPWAAVEFIDTTPNRGMMKVKVLGIPMRLPPKVLKDELELREAIAAQPQETAQ
jgi:hypothetical protein